VNVRELKERLMKLGVKDRAYDLSGNGDDETYCLESTSQGWVAYYRERGMKQYPRVFTREEDACEAVFEMISKDPTTRI
jgi:hypothetical protein